MSVSDLPRYVRAALSGGCGRRLPCRTEAGRVLPVYLTLFVTTTCNLRCRHCFYWQHINTKKDELTVDELERIARSLSPLLFLLFGGGEPFLRPDLADLAEIFHRHTRCRFLAITTNGTEGDRIETAVQDILERCPGLGLHVSVSLDDFPEYHDAIRERAGVYAAAVETLDRLKRMSAVHSNLNVGVTMVVSALNQDRGLAFYRHVRDNLTPDMISPQLIRGQPRQTGSLDVDLDVYQQIIDELQRDLNRSRLRGFQNFLMPRISRAYRIIRNERIMQIAHARQYISPCCAGALSAVMYSDGDVYPCEILEEERIGNIREFQYDFPALWASTRARQVRSQIREEACFCTHECAWTTNILFNPAYYPLLLKRALWCRAKGLSDHRP